MDFIFPAIALIICFLIVKFLKDYLLKKNVLDIPNDRSSHTIPTPRGGGIGISISIILIGLSYSLFISNWKLAIFLLISSGMAILGWLDDRKGGLSTRTRFIIQILLASFIILLFGGIDKLPLPSILNINLGYFGYPIALLWIVGISNIYNFLDGIDGYAGSQGVLAGLGWYLIFGNSPSGILGLIISASCLGFLFLNWHPAKIFMGDVGSAFLGFIIASLPFLQKEIPNNNSSFGFFALALLIWFFLADGTFTMIRRALNGEKIWEAHRSHIYQKLTIIGWKHSMVTILMISFSLVIISSLIYFKEIQFYSLLIAVFFFLIFLYLSTIKKIIKINNG